jgi:hypothetical protein
LSLRPWCIAILVCWSEVLAQLRLNLGFAQNISCLGWLTATNADPPCELRQLLFFRSVYINYGRLDLLFAWIANQALLLLRNLFAHIANLIFLSCRFRLALLLHLRVGCDATLCKLEKDGVFRCI